MKWVNKKVDDEDDNEQEKVMHLASSQDQTAGLEEKISASQIQHRCYRLWQCICSSQSVTIKPAPG